jgi:nucleoside-diphosphate-sugar epimerase
MSGQQPRIARRFRGAVEEAVPTSRPEENLVQTLVTGCAGFVGSHVVDQLLADGHAVRGVDCFTDYYDPAAKHRNLQDAQRRDHFELVHADLRTTDIVSLLDGVDVVYHLAGQPGVRVSWADGFADYVGLNVLVTQRILEAVRSRPIEQLVYASSSSVYGNAPAYPTTEADLPRPHSPYGVTKLAAEHLCVLYAENWHLPTVSLRYFTVYGPRQRPDMGFSRFLDAALNDQPVPVYGTGHQIRDFTFVADVADATIRAGLAAVAPGTVMNVAGGESISVNELVLLMGDLLGHPLSVVYLPDQPGDVQRTGAVTDRARALLGWCPRTPLAEGLGRQIAWTRAVSNGHVAHSGNRL